MSSYRLLLTQTAIKEMGVESLIGTIDLINGEKDPRNLMLAFSMLKVLMVEWGVSQHGETLFDAIFAYFPITFRPPPNDPYGITAQDLKDRLQECIASTSHLAPYAIPALTDKLDSTSPNVKVKAPPPLLVNILLTRRQERFTSRNQSLRCLLCARNTP